MLVAELGRNPDDHAGLLAGGVGEKLAEVLVVRRLKLVLDDHEAVAAKLAGHNVHREVTHVALALLALKLQTKRLAQLVEVVVEPGREVLLLVRPDGAGLDALHQPQRELVRHVV